jgi:hypothetical protein
VECKIKLKKLDLESGTFSLGEIACVFAGRFDLFVYSFAGKAESNEREELFMNSRVEVATATEASKATGGGTANAFATESARIIPNYAASRARTETFVAAIPNAEI